MSDIKQLENAKDFMVGVGVRIVPSGVASHDNKNYLRASLILSPIAAPGGAAACGEPIDIRQWPERIEAMLRTPDEISVSFVPVKGGVLPSPVGGKFPKPISAFRSMFLRRGDQAPDQWERQRNADVAKIGKLWSHLVAPKGVKDWQDIITALKAAGTGSASFQRLKTADTRADVRAIGRGHSALLLALERGRSLLSRVKLDLHGIPCDDRSTECDLASPLVQRSYLTPKQREEALLKGGQTALVADEKAARQAYESSTPAQKKARDEELAAAERDAKYAARSYLTPDKRAEHLKESAQKLAEEERKARDAYEKLGPEEQQARDLMLSNAEREAQDKLGRIERTKNAQVRQKQVEEQHRDASSATTTAETLKRAYGKLLECAVSDPATECFVKASAESLEQLAQAIDGSVDRHKDAVYADDVLKEDVTNPKKDLEKEYEEYKASSAAPMRLVGLQTQPSLARLFNLVVDVWIPFDDFQREALKADAFVERRGVGGTSRFGFIAAALESRNALRRAWTTCKVRLVEKSVVGAPDVWSCTRAELDLFALLSGTPGEIFERDSLIANGALSQVDGVVYIAAARRYKDQNDKDITEPRFDIVSLDSAQAVENRQTSRTIAPRKAPPVVTLRTAGLALVDRWRETSALVQALRSLSRADNLMDPVNDAEDLTVGYRMDVAVSGKNEFKDDVLQWCSLCHRWINFDDLNFDDPDNERVKLKVEVEQILGRVIPDAAERLDFDSAVAVMPAKIQPTENGNAVAHVDDTVGHWMGPPIGVDTNSQEIDLALDANAHALQLGAAYSLSPIKPNSAPRGIKTQIPRLMFGGGYFFGLTPRLQGGVIRSFNNQVPYQALSPKSPEITDAERHFAILPSPTVGPRRFLRHERIECPIVTTPQNVLERVYDGVVDGLRETAKTIVVRSKPPDDKNKTYGHYDQDEEKKDIGSSLRVIFPPSVSAEFADRHGAFVAKPNAQGKPEIKLAEYRDRSRGTWKGPEDGLSKIDYDEISGGFPAYGYSATNRGRMEVADSPLIKPTGDAVLRPRVSGSSMRLDPYYPDPAARYFVISLRDLAGRMPKDPPLIVPIRPKGGAYPEVRPIAIDVVAKSSRSGRPPSHGRVLGLQAKGAKGGYLRGAQVLGDGKNIQPDDFKISAKDKNGRTGDVIASRVELLLEPGESFEIDVWCLPESAKQLATWFDIIESAALVASVDKATGEGCTDCLTFETKLKALKLTQLSGFVRKLGLSRAAADMPICGAADRKVPRGVLLCFADAAYKLLQARPTPELAARTTMVATHAIPQAHAKPLAKLKVRRGALLAPKSPQKPGDPEQNVLVEGEVTVDRPTTGFIEIMAQGASLVSNAFDDDQRRRRTPDEVARGIWPRSPVTDEFMQREIVYGFKIESDDKVELISEQATLLRIDEDVGELEGASEAVRDLAKLQAENVSAAKGGNVVRINPPFILSDSRARILKLWAVAGSRTAHFFRNTKGDIPHEAMASRASEPQTVIVPATKAPAKIAPLTILPAFKIEKDAHKPFTVERKVRLRVRMQRPWFSSGEGERLGVILWPPDILKGRVSPGSGSAVRDYDVGTGEKADIAMTGFKDEDLGPGGAFVTRWGLDPTKGGATIGWLTPPTAFPDFRGAATDPMTGAQELSKCDPVYVPRASVPIPVEDESGKKSRVNLEASLLTFVPRFDIDHETWYCDIEIRAAAAPEPFMRLGLVRYQPYAPPELRVSEPIVEWTQIPQQRSVSVTIDARQVTVNVKGTGTLYSASPTTGYDPMRVESWTQRPVMKISVMRQRSDGVDEIAELDKISVPRGLKTRAEYAWIPSNQTEWEEALALPSDDVLRDHCAVRPEHPYDGAPLSWCAKFTLNDTPLKPKKAGTVYSVVVEEVQPMLPAAYAEEPIENVEQAAKVKLAVVCSGPRFAAVVALGAEDKVAKPREGAEPKPAPSRPAPGRPPRYRSAPAAARVSQQSAVEPSRLSPRD